MLDKLFAAITPPQTFLFDTKFIEGAEVTITIISVLIAAVGLAQVRLEVTRQVITEVPTGNVELNKLLSDPTLFPFNSHW